MTDAILKKIDEITECGCSEDRCIDMRNVARVAVEELARVPACDSNSCTTCDAIAEIATILGVKEGEK